ncbi:hypothetical protein TNCV_820461 [Trichonephila clavipes]|nr:hypothetical protein TNCV_820461 [Trichonephila clavipes]
MLEKSNGGNLTVIAGQYTAVNDAANHVDGDHVGKEEPSISTFFRNVHDKSSFYDLATRGLLVMDPVILSHGQMTRTTPELALPSHHTNYHTTPKTFELSADLKCIAALYSGSSAALGSNS